MSSRGTHTHRERETNGKDETPGKDRKPKENTASHGRSSDTEQSIWADGDVQKLPLH